MNVPLWVYWGFLRTLCRDSHNIHTGAHRLMSISSWQDDEVVLQCVACIQKENRKFCLAAEGLGNRLCYLEPTSEAKVGTAVFDSFQMWAIARHLWLFSLQLYNGMHVHMQTLIYSVDFTWSCFEESEKVKGCVHAGKSTMETSHPLLFRPIEAKRRGTDRQLGVPPELQQHPLHSPWWGFLLRVWGFADISVAPLSDVNSLKVCPWTCLIAS